GGAMPDNGALKDLRGKVVTPVGWREAVGHLKVACGMSERRACRALGVDRTSVRYQATRAVDGTLRERLKDLAQECRRFGYRRLHVPLRRGAMRFNKKRGSADLSRRSADGAPGGQNRAICRRRSQDVPLAATSAGRWTLPPTK